MIIALLMRVAATTITVRNHTVLRLFGFTPISPRTPAFVRQDLTGWMRSAWWRLRHPLDWG